MTPKEAARTIRGCLLCDDTRIAAVGFVVPGDEATLDALLKLRSQPLPDGETPTVWFGLCPAHARHGAKAAARIQSRIQTAARTVATH